MIHMIQQIQSHKIVGHVVGAYLENTQVHVLHMKHMVRDSSDTRETK